MRLPRKQLVQRRFKCPVCGYVIIAFKKASFKTPNGHLKKLWCPRCKDEHNCIQISEWEGDNNE